MREEIAKRVLNVIEDMDLDEPLDRDIILHADYAEDEIFSSITFVLLIVLLEEEFEIEIDGDHLLIENLSTFDRIIDLIEELIGA